VGQALSPANRGKINLFSINDLTTMLSSLSGA